MQLLREPSARRGTCTNNLQQIQRTEETKSVAEEREPGHEADFELDGDCKTCRHFHGSDAIV